MSIAHSTLTGETIVDRGRPTPIFATTAQASDNTAVPALKAVSSSPSAYDEPQFPASESPKGGGSALGETLATPVTIPPDHLPGNYRTLVLCFDGTGDQFDADNSNIVQLVALLKKSDRSKQMVYYQVSCFCFMRGFFFFLNLLMIVLRC